MEICEDMVVDLNVVNLRKRQCKDTVLDHPLNKRTCQGLEKVANSNGVLLNDYEMVYWQAEVAPSVKEPVNGFNGGIQQHCMSPQNPPSVSPQICPRCVAGESGHINHILRL